MNMIKRLSSPHGLQEGLWVSKITAASAVMLSDACREARQMSESSLTCHIDKQLTYSQAGRVRLQLSSPWTELLWSIFARENRGTDAAVIARATPVK